MVSISSHDTTGVDPPVHGCITIDPTFSDIFSSLFFHLFLFIPVMLLFLLAGSVPFLSFSLSSACFTSYDTWDYYEIWDMGLGGFNFGTILSYSGAVTSYGIFRILFYAHG